MRRAARKVQLRARPAAAHRKCSWSCLSLRLTSDRAAGWLLNTRTCGEVGKALRLPVQSGASQAPLLPGSATDARQYPALATQRYKGRQPSGSPASALNATALPGAPRTLSPGNLRRTTFSSFISSEPWT